MTFSTGICQALHKLLIDSTAIYPRSQQRLGEFTVGWLQRY